jgi:hypothetical protein
MNNTEYLYMYNNRIISFIICSIRLIGKFRTNSNLQIATILASSLTHGGVGSLLLQHPWVYWYDNHCFWIVTNFRVFHNNRNNIQNFPISRIEQIMKDMIRLVYIYKYSWYADKLKWWQSADLNLYEIFLKKIFFGGYICTDSGNKNIMKSSHNDVLTSF